MSMPPVIHVAGHELRLYQDRQNYWYRATIGAVRLVLIGIKWRNASSKPTWRARIEIPGTANETPAVATAELAAQALERRLLTWAEALQTVSAEAGE